MLRKQSIFVLSGVIALAGPALRADTIAGFKALLSTTPVSDKITGAIVTNVIPFSATATTTSFQIQDATGAIQVFSMPMTTYTPSVGDMIDVTGLSETFHGLYETAKTTASPYVVALDSTGNSPPPLTTFTQAEFQPSFGSSLQSFIGSLNNEHFTGPGTFSANGSYQVDDGTGTLATIFIPSNNPLIGQAVPAGAVDLTGYYGEFDGPLGANKPPDNTGHELIPLQIQSVPEPISAGLLGIVGCATLLRRRRA